MSEQLDSIESKIKHLSSSVDSLHVKSNIFDSHVKQLVETQKDQSTLISTLTSNLADLIDRVNQLESTSSSSCEFHAQNENNHQPHSPNPEENPKYTKTQTSNSGKEPRHLECTNSSPPNSIKIECDILILSDSMLKRIQPRRFTPRGKTVVRFIRGGANACSNFVENNCHKYNPKKVLIHIGTRDLPNGIKKEDFIHLLSVCSKSWENSQINILPVIYHKDF